jgi:Fur family transcriptional regulator, zinc uptake regulator
MMRREIADQALLSREISERIGFRATPLRCGVLRVLEKVGRPIGAHEILERVNENLGRQLAPPSIYRTLDFLLERKLAIRIVSLNAFLAVSSLISEDCIVCLCDGCGHAEIARSSSLSWSTHQAAADLGFRVTKPIIELHGLCIRCIENRD